MCNIFTYVYQQTNYRPGLRCTRSIRGISGALGWQDPSSAGQLRPILADSAFADRISGQLSTRSSILTGFRGLRPDPRPVSAANWTDFRDDFAAMRPSAGQIWLIPAASAVPGRISGQISTRSSVLTEFRGPRPDPPSVSAANTTNIRDDVAAMPSLPGRIVDTPPRIRTYEQTCRQTYGDPDRRAYGQTYIRTDVKTDIRTDVHTDRREDGHMDIWAY